MVSSTFLEIRLNVRPEDSQVGWDQLERDVLETCESELCQEF